MTIENYSLYGAITAGAVVVLGSLFLYRNILRQPRGDKKMQEIALAIQQGAKTYLNRQYRVMVVVALVVFVLLGFLLNWTLATGFLVGVILSAACGFIDLNISVRANERTAEAASNGLNRATNLSFWGGAVTGLTVTGLGLFGVSLFYLATKDVSALMGLALGGSLLSIFARLGGGIFSKGVDIAAGLVSKQEKDIPEDDPRNPAVLADSVGDNIGDGVGMAADLFETYVVTLVSVMILGVSLFPGNDHAVFFPLALAGAALIASVIGIIWVGMRRTQNIGLAITTVLAAGALYPITHYVLLGTTLNTNKIFGAGVIGLTLVVLGVIITKYYTSDKYSSVRKIAVASTTGHVTNILAGLSLSMRSIAWSILLIALGSWGSYQLGGFYGLALASFSFVSVVAIFITTAAAGPINDNALDIAMMANLSSDAKTVTGQLDNTGNNAKAITKNFATISAGLASITLFVVFTQEIIQRSHHLNYNLLDLKVLIGLLVGGTIPYLFSGLNLQAVERTAAAVIAEVRIQFKERRGLLEGKVKPDYARAVSIAKKAALREMILPTLLLLVTPIAVGYLLGASALGGLIIGTTTTGLLLALSMTNSGAAWEKAKKYIEAGALGGLESPAHQAAITGDTIGDSFKDATGAALTPMMKIIGIISILLITLILK